MPILRRIHEAYLRQPDVMPVVLKRRLYPTNRTSQQLLIHMNANLNQPNLAKRHLLAPLQTIHSVAIEAIHFFANACLTIARVLNNLGQGEFKQAFDHFVKDLTLMGNGLLFVASGTLASLIAIIIPSVLKVFKTEENLHDTLYSNRLNDQTAQIRRDLREARAHIRRLELAAQIGRQALPAAAAQDHQALRVARDEIRRLEQALAQRPARVAPNPQDNAPVDELALVVDNQQAEIAQLRARLAQQPQVGLPPANDEIEVQRIQIDQLRTLVRGLEDQLEQRRAPVANEDPAERRQIIAQQEAAYQEGLRIDQAREAEEQRARVQVAPPVVQAIHQPPAAQNGAERRVHFPTNPNLPSPAQRRQPHQALAAAQRPAAVPPAVEQPPAAQAGPAQAPVRRPTREERADRIEALLRASRQPAVNGQIEQQPARK